MKKNNYCKYMEKMRDEKAFTLIELMVAIFVFSIVMVISSGSILSVFDANHKSQSLRSVMDNLNFTMEGITRTIRFGRTYHCDATQLPINLPRDCGNNSPSDSFAVISSSGDQVIYKLINGRIIRSINDGADYPLTSPDITITKVAFRVFGSAPYPDLYQPQVIIVIAGYAGVKPSTQSAFSLETEVSQRTFDFQ